MNLFFGLSFKLKVNGDCRSKLARFKEPKKYFSFCFEKIPILERFTPQRTPHKEVL
jgi:hypothetical protein